MHKNELITYLKSQIEYNHNKETSELLVRVQFFAKDILMSKHQEYDTAIGILLMNSRESKWEYICE